MINPQFSKFLFWDTDYEKVDFEKNARYVIEKVVMFGNIRDWRMLQNYYGMQRIKEVVVMARDLDPKTLNLLSLIFNVPKKEFRCYNYIQSNRIHWNY